MHPACCRDGRVADAQRSIQAILEAEPDCVDALYILAVCQRFSKQPEQTH